ncbi:flagellar motor switch protein FliG [Candidatus Formimonas warabiya]|uniref:Flagellar motor switch protein FliG n=1 Tax=Formimonas warabiya TaxID=1761012 RepID=A0A3G1KU18_FORW1|nr:flagellar motor switch protein FliG [Candidatus Formimonas warabiya]ATW25665.1 flagellar motor switch protein FliG [Candidatus Formimonas warabiya]
MGVTKVAGVRKIAVVLMAMGAEASSRLLKQYFNEDEIEKITFEISRIANVSENMRHQIMNEFLELAEAQRFMLNGGIKYARELLEKTVGGQRAKEILNRLMEVNKKVPFGALKKVDPKRLVSLISDEHPQTVALILGYLDPTQASVVMSALPDDMKADIAKRIALLEQVSPEVVDEVETVIERKLSNIYQSDYKKAGGITALVDILNRVDRGTERYILNELENQDSDLVEEIRQRLIVFEDIITLDDLSIQRVLKDVDYKDLALALKAANDSVAKRIYNNLSQRIREMIKAEIEFMGPVRVKEVEEAQQKIVKIIRNLEEAGEIVIARGGEGEELFV